jgi:hypothetical protein
MDAFMTFMARFGEVSLSPSLPPSPSQRSSEAEVRVSFFGTQKFYKILSANQMQIGLEKHFREDTNATANSVIGKTVVKGC